MYNLVAQQYYFIFLSDEEPTLEKLDFAYRQYTNLFIFWFVSEHWLRSTLRLFHQLSSIVGPTMLLAHDNNVVHALFRQQPLRVYIGHSRYCIYAY